VKYKCKKNSQIIGSKRLGKQKKKKIQSNAAAMISVSSPHRTDGKTDRRTDDGKTHIATYYKTTQ